MANWSFVAAASHSAPAGSNSSSTFPACLANDLLIVSHCGGTNMNTIAVSDSLGNSWTQLGYFYDATNGQYTAWWAAVANGAGSPVVTFTNQGTSFVTIITAIYRAALGTPVLDQYGNSLMAIDTGSGTDAINSPSATTTKNGELILGLVQNLDDGTTFTAGTGFTEDAEQAEASDCLSQIEHMEQTSAGSAQALWTLGSSKRCTAAIATFSTTWTHVQSTGAASVGPLAYASNVQAGTLLIAMQESDDASTPTTPTDTRGNAWSLIHTYIDSQRITWWWAISNGAGANTLTFDISAGFNAVKVSEWSVDSGTISLDVADGIQRTGIAAGTDVFTSPSVSAATDDSLVLGAFASQNGDATTYTAGTNFVELNQTSIVGSAADKFVYEARAASAGSVQALFSSAGATTQAVVSVAVFKATTATPPTPTTWLPINVHANRQVW